MVKKQQDTQQKNKKFNIKQGKIIAKSSQKQNIPKNQQSDFSRTKNQSPVSKKTDNNPKTLKSKKNQKQIQNNKIIQLKEKQQQNSQIFPRPDIELFRLQVIQKANQKFLDLCKSYQITPLMTALDRWRWQNKFLESQQKKKMALQNKNLEQNLQEISQKLSDGMIKNTKGLEAMLIENLQKQTKTPQQAQNIANSLSNQVKSDVQQILEMYKQQKTGKVIIENNSKEKTYTIFYQHTKCNSDNKIEIVSKELLGCINEEHYDKLFKMFSKNNPQYKKKQKIIKEFEDNLFCLVARYNSFQGPGSQAAIPEQVFKILQQEFGVKGECFASPMNCFLKEQYFSAFDDTDIPFGSQGNFFEFYPQEGSFQANPPFIPELMLAMVDHMESILQKSQQNKQCLSFCVIVPSRDDQKYWNRLIQSKYQTGKFIIQSTKHQYKEGFQHQVRGHRASTFDTGFVFLQNTEGKKKWPFSQKKEILLRVAMKVDSHKQANQ